MTKKRPVLLLAVIGAVLAVVRRRKAGRSEADLWHEATSARPALSLRLRTSSIAPPGDVAQLAEHRLCKAGVGGSSPLVSTSLRVRCAPTCPFAATRSAVRRAVARVR